MIGFNFNETMTGTHFLNGTEGKFEFIVRWGPDNIFNWLNVFSGKFLSQPLHGIITADGICEEQECEGTLELKYWKGKIRYTIFFTANDIPYKYVGEKRDIRPWNLHRTHTTCYGILTNLKTNEVVSEPLTYFRLKTLPAFLLSFGFSR